MRIRDTSSFNVDDLRALIAAGCKHMGVPTRGLVVEVDDGWRGKHRKSRAVYGTRRQPGRWMRIVVLHHDYGTDPGAESGLSARERFYAMRWGRPVEGDVLADSEVARGMAHVIEHECLHLLGARHRDMTQEQRYFTRAEAAGKTYPWAAGLGIRRKPAVERTPLVVRLELARAARTKKSAQTEARMRDRLACWEGRLKTAQRKVSELRGRVRYYDRKAAAGGAP